MSEAVCEAVYREMYCTLFQQVTRALDALQARNYGSAEQILQDAQKKIEALYIEV